MSTSDTREPICQHQDVFGHGRKVSDLFLELACLIQADQASNDQFLVHIETTTTAVDNLHLFPPSDFFSNRQRAGRLLKEIFLYVLTLAGATDGGCLKTSPIRFVAGS
jgi:hypothetical protein